MQSGIPRVSEAVQRFAFDPLLAAFAFAFAIASASALLFLFDRWGGYFGNVVSPASHKLAALEGLRGVLAFSVVIMPTAGISSRNMAFGPPATA